MTGSSQTVSPSKGVPAKRSGRSGPEALAGCRQGHRAAAEREHRRRRRRHTHAPAPNAAAPAHGLRERTAIRPRERQSVWRDRRAYTPTAPPRRTQAARPRPLLERHTGRGTPDTSDAGSGRACGAPAPAGSLLLGSLRTAIQGPSSAHQASHQLGFLPTSQLASTRPTGTTQQRAWRR